MELLNFKLIRGYNNEIDLNIRTVEVREGRRTIRAQWNPEVALDIDTYHRIDAEAELTRMLSEEFARTIAQNLVSTQPLQYPSGVLHYLDYNYNVYFMNFKLLRG
jgi:hypothetical protein